MKAARKDSEKAVEMGEEHGYRNAQVTVIAPTGTIGLVMDCDTTGIEPDFALVKFKKLALAQPYTWFIGMTLMSNALHRAGLAGIPRRVSEPEYRTVTYDPPFGTVAEMQWQTALGGTILFISLVFFLIVIVASWRGAEESAATIDDTIPAALSGPEHSPKILDNMKLWIGIAILLVILAYSLPLADMVMDGLFYPGAPPSPV